MKVTKSEKLLRGWAEVIDKMSESDPAAAPFLNITQEQERNLKAYPLQKNFEI